MNAAHWHLILNHVPVIGTAFGIPFLIVGLIRHNNTMVRSSFWIFIFVGLFSFPVYFTGEPTAEIVSQIPGVSQTVIEEHEEAAETAFVGAIVLGLLAAVGLAAHRMRKQVGRVTVALVLICSIIVFVLMAGAANQGGEIRHQEIKKQSSPGSNEQLVPQQPADDDD